MNVSPADGMPPSSGLGIQDCKDHNEFVKSEEKASQELMGPEKCKRLIPGSSAVAGALRSFPSRVRPELQTVKDVAHIPHRLGWYPRYCKQGGSCLPIGQLIPWAQGPLSGCPGSRV